MERLTEKIGNTNCVKGCGSNCKYGFQYCSKEDWENCQTIDDVVDKLADYEYLEEQGRLVKLPCKVGCTVYCTEDKKIWDCIVDKVTISRTNGVWFEVKTPKSMPNISAIEYTENTFGKTVFLTKSEAEAKLKELRGSNE